MGRVIGECVRVRVPPRVASLGSGRAGSHTQPAPHEESTLNTVTNACRAAVGAPAVHEILKWCTSAHPRCKLGAAGAAPGATSAYAPMSAHRRSPADVVLPDTLRPSHSPNPIMLRELAEGEEEVQ